MSVGTALVARAGSYAPLTALIADRFYRGAAPQEVTAPYVVFFRVSTVIRHAMGVRVKQQSSRYQFDLYASTAAEIDGDDQLLDQLIACFDRYSDSTIIDMRSMDIADDGENDSVVNLDTETQLFKTRVDIMVDYTAV